MTLTDGNEWLRPVQAQNLCQGLSCDDLPLGQENPVDLLHHHRLFLLEVVLVEDEEEQVVVAVVAW